MFLSLKRCLKCLTGMAVVGMVVAGGCKRAAEPAPPTPPATPPPAIAAPAPVTEIAPASPQPVVAAPPAPNHAAPVLLSRTIWPSVELADGRVLERVRVSAEDGATVTLMHSGGIAKVDKRTLPKELAAAHPYDAGAAQLADEQAAARRKAAAVAPTTSFDTSSPAAVRKLKPAPAPEPQPETVSSYAIEAAVNTRARRYFETEKRLGSGQTLVFQVLTNLSEPREVPGWSNRWEVTGTAGYKVYNSIGWGSFSKRSTKFIAIVEGQPGKKIVVVSFEERT